MDPCSLFAVVTHYDNTSSEARAEKKEDVSEKKSPEIVKVPSIRICPFALLTAKKINNTSKNWPVRE